MSCTAELADRLTDRQRRHQLTAAAVCLCIVVGGWVYRPYVHDGPVVCPHRLATGLPCPACGLTRSVCATMHGNLTEAMSYNLLGPLVVLASAVGVPLMLIQVIRHRPISWLNRVLFSSRVAWTLATAVMAWHAGRILCIVFGGRLLDQFAESVPGRLLEYLL